MALGIAKRLTFIAKEPKFCRIWSYYLTLSGWETDQVISKELYSDLSIATLCVFITTTIFIGHFVTSFTVLGPIL